MIQSSHGYGIAMMTELPIEDSLGFNVDRCFFTKFNDKLLEFRWLVNIEQAHQISFSGVNLSCLCLHLSIYSLIETFGQECFNNFAFIIEFEALSVKHLDTFEDFLSDPFILDEIILVGVSILWEIDDVPLLETADSKDF